MRRKIIASIIFFTFVISVFSACGQPAAINGTADNDIVTFTANFDNKPIIRIGSLYYLPETGLVDALSKEFPEYVFVLDMRLAAGVDSAEHLNERLANTPYYDMVISNRTNGLTDKDGNQLFFDLSAESFLNNYLLSSLNDVSHNGHIYCVPGTSTLAGIAFNVDMFNENGWSVPKTHDEFFALCDEIEAAGIKPFSTNFKYTSQITRILPTMVYSELFGTVEGVEWIAGLPKSESSFTGYAEPMFELMKRFADNGLITADNFTASLTKQRQAFWAREYAMIEYDSVIYTYAETESAPFELGIMPYPAANADDAGFSVTPEYYVSIPATVGKNPKKLSLMIEILTFLSTQEGQDAMLADSLRISNVKNMQFSDNPATKYAKEAYEKGNLFPIVPFNSAGQSYYGLMQQATLDIANGGSVANAVKFIDNSVAASLIEEEPAPVVEEPVATATESFTMLETSYYIADKLRQASGAEVALVINGGFFRSNLSCIFAGDISPNMEVFTMKGVTADDKLTLHKMTGKQLKEALEYPIVNDTDIDAFIAASGLSVKYAPWNNRGSRVISVTLENGDEINDEALYTVAAWAGVVNEKYITETVKTFDDLGTFEEILLAAFINDKTISPDIERRVELVWVKE